MNTLANETTNLQDEELYRAENEYWAGMAEAVLRLKEHPDFKKVILEGYFKDKAVNGVSMLATDHVIRNNLRGQVMESLVAISHLQDYLIMVESLGIAPELEDEDEEEATGV